MSKEETDSKNRAAHFPLDTFVKSFIIKKNATSFKGKVVKNIELLIIGDSDILSNEDIGALQRAMDESISSGLAKLVPL